MERERKREIERESKKLPCSLALYNLPIISANKRERIVPSRFRCKQQKLHYHTHYHAKAMHMALFGMHSLIL